MSESPVASGVAGEVVEADRGRSQANHNCPECGNPPPHTRIEASPSHPALVQCACGATWWATAPVESGVAAHTDQAAEPLELVAAAVHEAWMAGKRAQGVHSRRSESSEELMVPYAVLSEAAKELDRGTVRAVLPHVEPLIAARVRAEAVATERRRATEVIGGLLATVSGLKWELAERDARVRAEERQRALREAILELHREARWQKEQELRDPNARVTHRQVIERLDVVIQVLRDRAAGSAVPVATPESSPAIAALHASRQAQRAGQQAREAADLGRARGGSCPVAAPTEPAPVDLGFLSVGESVSEDPPAEQDGQR